MAILHVAKMGHPILRRVAEPIADDVFKSEAFQRLCDDMIDTMVEYGGVGLAAPQGHNSIRLLVADILEEGEGPLVLANPVLTPIGESTTTTPEGCLSVPDLRGNVVRPDHIILEAQDRFGNPISLELEGFTAVVVQHEADHLDGVLYIDRADTKTMAFLPEFNRYSDEEDYK